MSDRYNALQCYLTTIDGKKINIFHRKSKDLYQTFNIPYSSAGIYCAVIPFVTRCSRYVCYQKDNYQYGLTIFNFYTNK